MPFLCFLVWWMERPVSELSLQQPILYSHPDDPDSHRVRFLLAEKGLRPQLVWVDPQDRGELAELNPYNTLPLWAEKNLRLYAPEALCEYLEDRYRQPRLLPDHPQQRAEVRQLAWRIRQDWLEPAWQLLQDRVPEDRADPIRRSLQDSLVSLNPLFARHRYFLQDELGWCDVLLAPLLWRLPSLSIPLPPALCPAVLAYCARLFARPAFLASLSVQEQRHRNGTLHHATNPDPSLLVARPV